MPEKTFADIFIEKDSVIEIRVLRRGGKILAGYFSDRNVMSRWITSLDAEPDTKGIYFVLNPFNNDLLERNPNRLSAVEKATTDADIQRRRWLYIDFDPVKAKGTPSDSSSTDSEKDAARQRMEACRGWMKDHGFPESIVADSGNGYHLHYRIDLPNDEESKTIVSSVLKKLDSLFGVDTGNHNAARICKLYGTMCRKGENTQERPHRRCMLISVPDVIEVVTKNTLVSILDTNASDVASDSTTRTQTIKSQYQVPSGDITVRHPELVRMVGKLYSANFSFPAILDAVKQENKMRFNPPKTDSEIEFEVTNAYSYILKRQDTRNKRDSEKNSGRTSRREELDEYIVQSRGWFERNGRLYLQVIDASGEIPMYSYATVGEDGNVSFIDELVVKEPIRGEDGKVQISGVKFAPRALPINKDGQPIYIVGMPDVNEISSVSVYDASSIRDMIRTHVSKYCDLGPTDLDLSIYYILATWFYPKLNTVPYLRFRADTGKGKSRILNVVSDLTFMPVKAGGASTAAGIIRFSENWHGTLVVDEADLRGESEDGGYTNDMIKYLNLGFEKGQYFIKSDKVDPKTQEIFDPFCPKVIAMRGVFQDPATEGRCLSISPSETERKDIPSNLPPGIYDREVGRIRACLARFAILNWGCITENDPYPDFNDVECEPRLKQLGSPLARILEKILPDGLAEFKHYVERRQVEVKLDRASSFMGSCVNNAYDIATESDSLVSVHSVAESMGVTSQKVSRTLKDVGMAVEARLVTITIQLPNQPPATKRKTQKVVVCKSARAWREIVRRYIVPKENQNVLLGEREICCPLPLRSNEFVEN